ncbi:hypothetical protein B0J12DRAFT_209391 [Macrophomina phaseolina]|uniref:Uncharacterized protein n=1 Tax=Macrophomina phaseolina TaxID=35725 RepID=A0ABQ8G1R4_9PEZI|nr:hypothetical protein B0J12DRAFT_209391 [Macrophomina phaseolina]
MNAESFSVADAPIVTEWRSLSDGAPTSFSPHPVSVAIAFDSQQKTVSFRLRLPVFLKSPDGRKSSFYLLIHPEHITSVDSSIDVPEHVASMLAAEPVGIRLVLARPGGVVVGPAHVDPTPKTKISTDSLAMLHSMAGAAEVTLYLACSSFSKARLQKLTCIANDNSWRPSPRLSNIPTFYSGNGGRILESNVLAPAISSPVAESPPSYDELAPTPPDPSSSRPGKKRRVESPPDQLQAFGSVCNQILEEAREECKRQIQQEREETRRYIAEEARRSHDEHEQRVKQEREETRRYIAEEFRRLREESERQLEARLMAKLDKRIEEKEAQIRLDFDKKIEEQGERIEERAEELEKELSDDIVDVESRCSDLIDFRLEEQLSSIKQELTEWVAEEMNHAEERIWNGLGEATFSMDP